MKVMDIGGPASAETADPAEPSKGSLIARLERLPRNAMQVRARLLIGTATFFDGFDVIVIAATLPLLIQKWGLSPAQVGFLIASGSVGQLIGTFLFPAIAERYGRVRSIAWSSGIIGAASIACGFAPTFAVFVALRVIQGLGLGGELPVAAAYINEITRAEGRGKFVLLYELVFPIGLLVSNGLGALIVPRLGWETMYFIGGVPVIIFALVRWVVPESPRWLAEKGRFSEASSALAAFEATVKGPLPPVTRLQDFDNMVSAHPSRRVRDLFGHTFAKRTIAVAMLWVTSGALQYGLATWLPTIYRDSYGAPLQLALNLSVGASIFVLLGGLACALLVDKVGRKPVITASFLLCAVSLTLAGVFHSSSIYLVALLCALGLGFMGSGFMTAYVYTPELYPTSIRAFACGLGGGWLKVAAIVAPALTGKLTLHGNLQLLFFCFAVIPVAAAICIHYLAPETKGKVLEELDGEMRSFHRDDR
ncbi:transport protein [Caballeronia temeraria]|uniref:Transport protein n=1 Tax=Caballeronia temeraria TaxID=1777137 RepID=A0A158DXV7_9BURK|nr:MFS transporter [Caballeronia temeraria]SAK99442.1 transport protein [Caballeronia temeraria]